MSKAKPYFISFIEEAVLNPDYAGYVAGRIEVYREGAEYADEEIRFLTRDLAGINAFRGRYDFEDVNAETLAAIRAEVAEKWQDKP